MADDKKKHLLAGFLIAGFIFAVAVFSEFPAPGMAAFAASVIAGIVKEVYDETGRGNPEVMDVVATAAGGVPFLIWGFYG